MLVTPAGYVFAIWGLIYLGLAGYAVWQSLPAQASNPRVRSLVAPMALGNVANGVWIFLWHHLWIGASLVAMLVLLACLIVAYLRLRAAPPGWRGAPLPASVWAALTLVVATVLGARMLGRYRDLGYAAERLRGGGYTGAT